MLLFVISKGSVSNQCFLFFFFFLFKCNSSVENRVFMAFYLGLEEKYITLPQLLTVSFN